MLETHRHRRNGLGLRNENGLMVCGICGRPYDEQSEPDHDAGITRLSFGTIGPKGDA